jgi:putative peptidoglycan lipid II flippase
MNFALINLAVNAAGSIGLFFVLRKMGYLPHVGIAIATTLAAWLNVVQLWLTLSDREHVRIDSRLARNLPRILLASVLMGAAVLALSEELAPYFHRSHGALVQFLSLAVLVGSGLAVFALATQILGVGNWHGIALRLLRRRSRA